MSDVVIPDVGEGGMDIIFAAWLVSEGQWVEPGDNLFELDTAKANLSVQAFASGRVEGLAVQAGDEVERGQVVAVLRDGATVGGVTSTPAAEKPPTDNNAVVTPAKAHVETGRAKQGRMSPKDKFRAKNAVVETRPESTSSTPSARPIAGAYRRATAASAIASWVQTPHVSATARSDLAWGLPRLVTALTELLAEHPELCVRWDGVQAVPRVDQAVGLLWAMPGGLVQTCVTADEAVQNAARAIDSARERADGGLLRPVDHAARCVNVQWIESESLESVSPVLPAGDSLMLVAVYSTERMLLSLVADQRCIDLHSLTALLDELCERGEAKG